MFMISCWTSHNGNCNNLLHTATFYGSYTPNFRNKKLHAIVCAIVVNSMINKHCYIDCVLVFVAVLSTVVVAVVVAAVVAAVEVKAASSEILR